LSVSKQMRFKILRSFNSCTGNINITMQPQLPSWSISTQNPSMSKVHKINEILMCCIYGSN
jgi:hypothetical protein